MDRMGDMGKMKKIILFILGCLLFIAQAQAATINLTSDTASGMLESDFDQIKLLIDGHDTGDITTMKANIALKVSTTAIDTPAELESVANLGAYASDFLSVDTKSELLELLDLEVGTDFYSVAAANAAFEGALGNPSTNGYVLSSLTDGTRSWIANGAGSMTYPDAGIPLSTGSAWGTSYTLTTLAELWKHILKHYHGILVLYHSPQLLFRQIVWMTSQSIGEPEQIRCRMTISPTGPHTSELKTI